MLLTWCSEVEKGTLVEFREVHDWLFNDIPMARRPKPNLTIGQMSTLGYLEVDWIQGDWAVAPPVLTLLPESGAVCLLTGARTRALIDAVADVETDDELSDIAPPTRHAQADGPTAILFPVDSGEALIKLADRLGVGYEFYASQRLAAILPSLDAMLSQCKHSVAPVGFEVKHFDTTRYRWVDVESDSKAGLYKYEAWGPPLYRLRLDHTPPIDVDLATGAFAEMRRLGQPILEFRQVSNSGELFVPLGIPLPTLHARTAALCSGLVPQMVQRRLAPWQLKYVNVPRNIADRIAQSLGQVLTSAQTPV